MAKYNYEKKDNTYLTPPALIRGGLSLLALEKNQIKVDKFDLDVCCSNNNIPAKRHYKNGEFDGLAEPWAEYNWCNPPFDECKKWVIKAYNEAKLGKTTIMLIPARTETAYFHDYILYNPNVEVVWLRKGHRFLDPETKQEMGVFKNALAFVIFRGIKSGVVEETKEALAV